MGLATATKLEFAPSFQVVDTLGYLPLGSVLKQEKLLYQSSLDFAYDNGGLITKEFIEKLPTSLVGNVIVDVRVHKLQPGYYPAIPGYHLDWIPRIKGGAEPDMSFIPDYEHAMLILGETSLTEFLNEPLTFSALPEEKPFRYVNDKIKERGLSTWSVSNGQIVHFTSRDWHRPVPAQKTEWRYLARASRVDHVKPTNEIRTQSQVYIPIEEASW